LLLKKRKEMREVDDALEFMKEEYASRMQACEERQREFERKQNDMKEQVTRFEKFINENDAKKQRAEMKARVEHRQCEQNEEKIQELRAELQKDEELKNEHEKKLDRLKKYKEYLDSTVDASEEEYEEINDVLNRYGTLDDANKDLMNTVLEGEKLIDKMREDVLKLAQETQNKILIHNSEIHGYQKNVESLRSTALQLDFERENLERDTNDKSRQTGQVIMSIKNLYGRCLSSMKTKVPHIPNTDNLSLMTAYLKLIQERIVDLNDITKQYQSYVERQSAR
jgi:chromosome segregation ATPase